jgi:hypothetical protein
MGKTGQDLKESNGFGPISLEGSNKVRLVSLPLEAQGIPQVGSMLFIGGIQDELNLLKEIMLKRLALLARQTDGNLDRLPQITQFMKGTALMRDMRIEPIQRRHQAFATIMNK